MLKKYVLFLILLGSLHLQGQTYVKVNALTTLLTIPHVGIELSIGEKSTFQFDAMASFWKSINGNPSQFLIFIPEYRYHFNEIYNGFYAGGHIGFTTFKFQKWHRLNSNSYEKGVGYLMGITVGYQKKINDRFLIDCFLGGGNNQGFYKRYYIESNERKDGATDYNKSGEWIPYRAGVMVSYRIK